MTSITVNQSTRFKNYQYRDAGGETRTGSLALDGALDHDVWDQLAPANSEHSGQFIRTLHDPRMVLQSDNPGPEVLGPAWREGAGSSSYEKHFVLGAEDGPHQEVVFSTGGRSGDEFEVITRIPGVLEHHMQGRTSFGELNENYLKEQVVLFAPG
ncbi:MAG: hypothetical protein AB1758_30095 [Candidatus Eremiobacterota bacterium]